MHLCIYELVDFTIDRLQPDVKPMHQVIMYYVTRTNHLFYRAMNQMSLS